MHVECFDVATLRQVSYGHAFEWPVVESLVVVPPNRVQAGEVRS